jgi:DNA-binding NtrC family response regulator
MIAPEPIELMNTINSKGVVFSLKTLKEVECELIDKTMEFYRGNITLVAKSLDMTRATLYRRLSEMKQTEEKE